MIPGLPRGWVAAECRVCGNRQWWPRKTWEKDYAPDQNGVKTCFALRGPATAGKECGGEMVEVVSHQPKLF